MRNSRNSRNVLHDYTKLSSITITFSLCLRFVYRYIHVVYTLYILLYNRIPKLNTTTIMHFLRTLCPLFYSANIYINHEFKMIRSLYTIILFKKTLSMPALSKEILIFLCVSVVKIFLDWLSKKSFGVLTTLKVFLF